MDVTNGTKNIPDYVRKMLNVLLIVLTSVLAVVTLFAIQDILIAITAFVVARTSEPGVTVQDRYIVVTVRNFWVFIGGLILLALLMVGIDYHTRRLGNPRTTKILLWTLFVEIIFIGLSVLI